MRSILVLLLAGHAGLLAAQSSAIHVDHFTADDGLAQNLVMRVLQDRTGYIWVATKRGLQRYDGYSFVQYTSLNHDAPSVLDGMIGYLEYDGRDYLWASAQGSLYRISLATQQVVRIALDTTWVPWKVAADGRVWVLDKGKLKVIEPGAAPHVRIVPTPPQFRMDGTKLFVTRNGAIWTFGNSGAGKRVQRFDPATGAVRWLDLGATRSPVSAMEDSAGRLWLAGLGVDVIDPGSDRARSLDVLRNVGTGGITADGATMLIATAEEVVRVTSAGTVIQRWSPPILSGGAGLPRDVAIDREGGVWLATTTSGLYRFDAGRPLFDYLSSKTIPGIDLGGDFVTALRELPDSSIWIGTMTSGAYRLSADGSKAEVFRHDPWDARSLGSDLVWGFEEDRSGNLWLATGRGLCTRGAGGFSCYRRAPDGATISDVARDADGWLWAIEYEPEKVGSFNPVTREYGDVVNTRHIDLAVYADPDSGYLWVGGQELLRARVRAGHFLTPLQPVPGDVGTENIIYDFLRDRSGVMWIASESGLQHWDGAKNRFAPVEVPELRNTTIFSIVEDELGRLWLGTAHGLVHYAPASGIAQRFRKQDGVMSGEFNRRAALRRRNGEMLFGGVQGMTRFRPEVVTAGRKAVPVVFTRLTRVAENQSLEGSVNSAEPVKLDKDDRAFTIEFAALTFAAGPVRRYRYQLENLNKGWMETSEHAVTYATPPPGHYVFRVQAAGGSDGEWSTPGAAVTFQVVPPFWQTDWFRIFIALAAIAGLWLLHRLRIARVLATERVRLRISRDLHDEIGVGLSSIALLSESVGTTGELTERDRTRLDKITQAARRMVADLRDIIWAIDPDEDHVEDVVARMRDEASVLLRDVDVSFHTPPASELAEGIGMAARRDLLLVFKEILHNITRHAHARAVRIELSVKRDRVQLIVSDDGVGFDPQAVRTGTGVKRMRERAARLGGRLDLISRPGQGTSVVLSLRARERAMAGPLISR